MQLRSVALSVMLLGASGVSAWAGPLSFSNTVDFDAGSDGAADHLGRTAIELSGTGTALFTYDYTHSVAFVPAAGSILGATLTLTHNGNRNSAAEVWLLFEVTDTPGIQIGTLSNSQGNSQDSWLDDTFTIPLALYPALPAGTWTLQLRLSETTSNPGGDQNDELWIDKSVLEGTYAPVPEPGTMLLLGSGLLGLAVRHRRTS